VTTYAVAITELGAPPETCAAALATLLGKEPYDIRLELAAGMPAMILTTPDLARATDIATRVRGLGHGVLAFDTAKVVSSDEMVSMKRFRLEPEGLGIEDRPVERFAYDNAFALVRAVHRFDAQTREEVQTKQLSGARALATGGLMLTKNVKKDVVNATSEKCNVLYIFRRDGGTPWILREQGTNYTALGASRTHSQLQNFAAAVQILRQRMASAPYDDRLLTMRRIKQGEAIARPGVSIESSTVPWTDLLAHVVAYTVAQRGVGPYRT
jgi:hypothetical protein